MAESKPNKTRRKAENSPKIKGKKFLIPAVILFVWWINNYTLKTVFQSFFRGSNDFFKEKKYFI